MVVYHGSIDKQSPSFYLPVNERGLHSLVTGHQSNKKKSGGTLGPNNRDRRFDVTDLWRQLNHPSFTDDWIIIPTVFFSFHMGFPNVAKCPKCSNAKNNQWAHLWWPVFDWRQNANWTRHHPRKNHVDLFLVLLSFQLCQPTPPQKKGNGGKPSQKHWLLVLMKEKLPALN